MIEASPWSVEVTAIAMADLSEIIAWTREQFGDKQAHVYADTLSAAIAALSEGPAIAGVKERSDIGDSLYTLHVARHGRKGRHFVVFRVNSHRERRTIEVLRLLHDAMDFERRAGTPDKP